MTVDSRYFPKHSAKTRAIRLTGIRGRPSGSLHPGNCRTVVWQRMRSQRSWAMAHWRADFRPGCWQPTIGNGCCAACGRYGAWWLF